jgi:hypothetical protein
MTLPEFSRTHMGAKSNNIKVLHDGLGQWINLPKSVCIPFKSMEYTLNLQPDIRDEINAFVRTLNRIKNVKRMNRILYKCKDLTMKLDFIPSDHMHAMIKKGLLEFGISEKDFP